jgi:membrane-bound inhibitor of C-type lysozyme
MNSKIPTTFLPVLFLLAVLVSGCGGMSVGNLLPFGDNRSVERSRVPANSTTYQCAGNKRFYVRSLENGAAAWVILPEREFRLDKVAGDGGNRFGNGKAELNINGDEASLSDGPTVNFTGCKIPPAPEPPKK